MQSKRATQDGDAMRTKGFDGITTRKQVMAMSQRELNDRLIEEYGFWGWIKFRFKAVWPVTAFMLIGLGLMEVWKWWRK